MSASPAAQKRPSPEQAAACFARLKQAIIDRTGHHYYADKDALLRDRLDRRVAATGCRGLPDYLSLLGQPVAGPVEWQELEAEVTIGETFFFRHTEQFDALRRVILPGIIAHNAATRSLRIWSAGCAVGAEPYSVAILLEQLLGERMRHWTIDIVGSDISQRALAQARDGRFSNWALRGMPEDRKAQDFVPCEDRRQWRIIDRHRRHVRFRQHNLLSLLDGAKGPDDARDGDCRGFDLILCRNVLIYFSPERIAPMLAALGRCLSPQGWLMVGHSDAIAALPAELRIVELPGTIVFRPPGPDAPAVTPPAPQHAAPQPTASETWAARRPTANPSPAAVVAGIAEPPVATIRALADAGRLRSASEACAAAIAAYPLDPRLHFYDGVIAQAAGQRTHAEAALRRAIYLSGEMVMAHYHLGLLLLDGATPEAGRRVMTHVAKLCGALPETHVLPESDGLSPRDLIERIGMRLRARRPAREV
ncbi:MAG: protein-glutamate methyltransferase [Proteobacteria bacterium]|nr:protein-glutamate methyltransferase [Pseudomonadota bacterium]